MSYAEINGLEHPPLQALWRRDGRAILVTAATTIALGCGTFIAARAASAAADREALMALFGVTVWTAVAAAPLAAGAATRLGALCRAGIIADASIVTLIVLGIVGGGQVSWLAGLKIYLLWAGLAVALSLVVPVGRGKLPVAVLAAVVATAAITSRFWAGGALVHLTGATRLPTSVTDALAAADVLGGVVDAAASAKPFIWAEQPVIYRLTQLCPDDPLPSPDWWRPTLTWWGIAAALAVTIAIRRTIRRISQGV